MDFCTALAAAIKAAPTSDVAASLSIIYEQVCPNEGGAQPDGIGLPNDPPPHPKKPGG